MTRRVAVVLNPAAGRGRGGRSADAIRGAFHAVGVSDFRQTTARGDEARLVREAIQDGCDTIVACGGDGTWGNCANAILASGADCRLALIATGTGNDFAKTAGAPARDYALTAQLAVDGPDVRVDVGRIEDFHFLNVSGFGFDIAVLEAVDHIRWLKGDALYFYAALRELFAYGGISIDVAQDGAPARGARGHLMLIVANAKHFGGTFRIAPQASLTDGKLDAIGILDASPLDRIRLFAAVPKGAHIGRPGVVSEQSARFTLRFASPPAYETDGEYRRARSETLVVSSVPAALRVVTRGLVA